MNRNPPLAVTMHMGFNAKAQRGRPQPNFHHEGHEDHEEKSRHLSYSILRVDESKSILDQSFFRAACFNIDSVFAVAQSRKGGIVALGYVYAKKRIRWGPAHP
jgi:hypothetical protein